MTLFPACFVGTAHTPRSKKPSGFRFSTIAPCGQLLMSRRSHGDILAAQMQELGIRPIYEQPIAFNCSGNPMHSGSLDFESGNFSQTNRLSCEQQNVRWPVLFVHGNYGGQSLSSSETCISSSMQRPGSRAMQPKVDECNCSCPFALTPVRRCRIVTSDRSRFTHQFEDVWLLALKRSHQNAKPDTQRVISFSIGDGPRLSRRFVLTEPRCSMRPAGPPQVLSRSVIQLPNSPRGPRPAAVRSAQRRPGGRADSRACGGCA